MFTPGGGGGGGGGGYVLLDIATMNVIKDTRPVCPGDRIV